MALQPEECNVKSALTRIPCYTSTIYKCNTNGSRARGVPDQNVLYNAHMAAQLWGIPCRNTHKRLPCDRNSIYKHIEMPPWL